MKARKRHWVYSKEPSVFFFMQTIDIPLIPFTLLKRSSLAEVVMGCPNPNKAHTNKPIVIFI